MAGGGLSIVTTFENKPRNAVVCSFSSLRASLSVFMLSFMICRSDSLVCSCCFKSFIKCSIHISLWFFHFCLLPLPFHSRKNTGTCQTGGCSAALRGSGTCRGSAGCAALRGSGTCRGSAGNAALRGSGTCRGSGGCAASMVSGVDVLPIITT